MENKNKSDAGKRLLIDSVIVQRIYYYIVSCIMFRNHLRRTITTRIILTVEGVWLLLELLELGCCRLVLW